MICSQESEDSAEINSKLLQRFKERKYYKNKRQKLEECDQASKKVKDKKAKATLDNTLYFQGRYMVPKAVLEKIALLMGYHIRPYSRAGIFVLTD